MTAQQSPKGKLLDIECLRAVAIVFTVIAHVRFSYAEVPSWVGKVDGHVHFWGGVDLFFVISGFVISRSLIPGFRRLEGAGAGARFVADFWSRRVFRLWPASWAWALLALGIIAVTKPETLFGNFKDVIFAFLQVYNFHAFACVLNQANCSHEAVGVYWSLSLEEQFYIFLPVLFVAARERARWVLVGLLIASFPINATWPGLGGFFRWEGFCLGVLLAWVHSDAARVEALKEGLIGRLAGFGPLLSLLCLVSLPFVSHGGVSSSLTYPLVAIVSFIWVALASFDVNAIGVPGWLRPTLVYLGARSYSIYLAHVPVFLIGQYVSRRWGELPGVWWPALWSGVVVLAAEGSYRFIEQRFRTRHAEFAPATGRELAS